MSTSEKFALKTLILDHNDSYTFNLLSLCHSVNDGHAVVVNYKKYAVTK